VSRIGTYTSCSARSTSAIPHEPRRGRRRDRRDTDRTSVGTQLPARDAAEGCAFVDTERAIAAAIFAAPGDLALWPRQYAPRSTMAWSSRMWLAWLGFAALGEQLANRPLASRSSLPSGPSKPR